MVGGSKNVELSKVLKDEARFFTFTAKEEDAVRVKELKLPAEARVVCYYREGRFALADEETNLQKGDEVLVLTHSKNMPALQKRWQPKPAQEGSAASASKKKKSKPQLRTNGLACHQE
jgi:trk system potassium uptake protein TrkA